MKTDETSKTATNTLSVEMEFMEEMKKHGLLPTETPCADGELHRIRDARDKPYKRDLYYRLFDDGYPEGFFGHWSRLPDKIRWQPKHKNPLSNEEYKERYKVYEQRRAAGEEVLLKRREKCRKIAAIILSKATEANPLHPYLVRKRIKPYGIMQLDCSLVIPFSKNGTITGLQLIDATGKKNFLYGSDTAGASFVIPGVNSRIYIAEGYATAATIHELTGSTVFVAFNCGNLRAVARIVKEQNHESGIVICADNDRHTPGNPGVTKAKEAAKAIGAKVAIPAFPGNKGTDFNDLVSLYGKGGAVCL